jgi:hypothetical protein
VLALSSAALVATLTASPHARAETGDVREVAARVEAQWTRAGARATALPSRFVFDDETLNIPIQPDPTARCTHVAILAGRGHSFHAKLGDASPDPLTPDPGARASSVAGVLELRRCDGDAPVKSVVVTSDGGRGAIEVVVGHGPSPMASLGSILPERTGGVLPPVPDTGALAPLPSAAARADTAEARARRAGATIAARSTSTAGEDGMGAEAIELPEGCHRLEVFGRDPRTERPGRRFRLDIDAELREPEAERLLARDRTEAPDARVEACVGQPSKVTLTYAGAVPASEVTITRATWPLPARLPPLWGPATRSKMARAMFARHIAVPADEAIFLAQGSSGNTPLHVPLEPGACYVAVAGVAHGHAKALQLRAIVGSRESTDERGAADEAALVAFCAKDSASARLEVHARGPGVGFGLAMFRVRSAMWEATP